MTDNTELKRLAEAANAVTSDARVEMTIASEPGPNQAEIDAVTAFMGAATPAAVVALIAENERLRVDLKSVVRLNNENADLFKAESERLESEAVYSAAGFDAAREEISKLRAEIAGLKAGYEAYERVNAELKAEVGALRKDADRYRWLRRAGNTKAIALVAEHCLDTLDEAIDAAMGQGEQS